jgi:hypothetical protein
VIVQLAITIAAEIAVQVNCDAAQAADVIALHVMATAQIDCEGWHARCEAN